MIFEGFWFGEIELYNLRSTERIDGYVFYGEYSFDDVVEYVFVLESVNVYLFVVCIVYVERQTYVEIGNVCGIALWYEKHSIRSVASTA